MPEFAFGTLMMTGTVWFEVATGNGFAAVTCVEVGSRPSALHEATVPHCGADQYPVNGPVGLLCVGADR